MSFTSSARSTWPRRASALVVALAALPVLAQGPGARVQRGDLDQRWFALAGAVEQLDPDAIVRATDDLLTVARRYDLRRLTPHALALVVRARGLEPAAAVMLLREAVRLDSRCPEAWFALAEARLRETALLAGVAALARGCVALVTDGRIRGLVAASALTGWLPVLLAGVAVWGLLAIRRSVARVWHDLAETGSLLRLGANATVFAAVVVALPLFAAADGVWLVLWLFALTWAYLPPVQKLGGVLGLLLVAATPYLLESGYRALTHHPNAVIQAAAALESHRYAPAILEDLGSLGDELGDDPDFYRLRGDSFRQYGLLDAAAWSYREGLRLAPDDGKLSLALGTVDYLQGDFNAALQAFDTARNAGVDPVIANYNLSLTLSQTYHFRESEEAMVAARQADAARLAELTAGRDQQLIIPGFSVAEAIELLARKDQVTLLNRGLVAPPLARERTIAHPLAIAALLSLVVAIGHALIRSRSGGTAGACIKCGRTFCRRCKLTGESQSYCKQCVNIFLRKDMVAIETQVMKRRQVARYQRLRLIERRFWDLVLPGTGVGLTGRPILGLLLALLTIVGAGLFIAWPPDLLSPILLEASLTPIRAMGAVAWLVALLTAQLLPLERR